MKTHECIGHLLLVLIAGVGGSLAAVSGAWSQQKQSVSVSIPAGAAAYTQEHLLEVGDVPGHQVRAFELRVDFQNINLSFGGVKIKELWVRGLSDYTNGSGTASNYDMGAREWR